MVLLPSILLNSVRVGIDCDGNKYAIKLLKNNTEQYNEEQLRLLIAEANALKILKHPQICALYEFNEHGKILMNDPYREEEAMYMALELVPNGELYAYIDIKRGFTEEICRLYFLELLEIIGYMHSKHICHRDLKLENIMLDKSYHLKLLDFGFSKIIPYHSGQSTLLKGPQGTIFYMAPELLEDKPYDGKLVDIFAMGVILFALRTGTFPFNQASIYDQKYAQIKAKAPSFWLHFPGLSDDFKSLIFHMLAYNPSTRYNLTSILNHPWCKGPTATEAERNYLFSHIHEIMLANAANNALLTKSAKAKEEEIYREDGEPALDKGLVQELIHAPPKLFFPYDPVGTNEVMSFKTTIHPNVVMHIFETAIKAMEPSNLECDDKCYQILFNTKFRSLDLGAQIQICKVKDKLFYINIQRTQVHC
jgi:serine/threonine protein kinase